MAEAANDAPPIIVGVDGSDSSYTALREAVRLATALGAPLKAIAVWDYPTAMYDVYAPPTGWSPQSDAEHVLDDAAEHVFGSDVPPWFSTAVRQGGAAAALVKESRGARCWYSDRAGTVAS
jgi:nucleotide-binding universal stress UspA family protein